MKTPDKNFLETHRFIQGRRVLSGCLYCQGAVFWAPNVLASDSRPGVYKCFHCGRMFVSDKGHLTLWPYREYEHLKKYRGEARDN